VGPFNWKKTGDFLVITVRGSAVSSPQKLATFFAHDSFQSGIAHFSRIQKFAAPFVGPLFVGLLFGRTCLNPPLEMSCELSISTLTKFSLARLGEIGVGIGRMLIW